MIIRQLKIYQQTSIGTDRTKKLYEFLNEIFSKIYVAVDNTYYTEYFVDDIRIADKSRYSKVIHISKVNYYDILLSYKLSIDDITKVTNYMFNKKFNTNEQYSIQKCSLEDEK